MGAFPLSEQSADSALLLTLVPGAYPAQTLGLNNATGVALVEVYDDVGSTPTSGRLTNAAVRTHNPSQRGQRHERSRTGGSVRGSVIRSSGCRNHTAARAVSEYGVFPRFAFPRPQRTMTR